MTTRPIHPDFQKLLDLKSPAVVELFIDLRSYMLELHPEVNELLYHTHALTAVFSVSEKLGNAYCHIPVYSGHINLGFNKGTLLKGSGQLLQGTGKLIRHLPIRTPADYRNPEVSGLIMEAIDLAVTDMDGPIKSKAQTLSKIK